MFVEMSVIVDGALETEETFTDEALLRQALAEVKAEAEGHGYKTDVLLAWHDHETGIDCECSQYVQDHRPAVTFNPDGPGTSAIGRWS